MSPACYVCGGPIDSFPRASGDEPRVLPSLDPYRAVFPARAGMSPPKPSYPPRCNGFPRASGDEPCGTTIFATSQPFSPRERG